MIQHYFIGIRDVMTIFNYFNEKKSRSDEERLFSCDDYAFFTLGLLGLLYLFACLIALRSSFNDLYRDTIIKMMTTENGKAASLAVFCKASRPPENKSTAATADWIIPQLIFTLLDGFNDP